MCYATGEESLRQIGQRSIRLGLDASSMNLLADTSIENVLSEAQKCKARVLVIDSMQTMTSETVQSAPGSVAQLRDGVGRIVQFAKKNDKLSNGNKEQFRNGVEMVSITEVD